MFHISTNIEPYDESQPPRSRRFQHETETALPARDDRFVSGGEARCPFSGMTVFRRAADFGASLTRRRVGAPRADSLLSDGWRASRRRNRAPRRNRALVIGGAPSLRRRAAAPARAAGPPRRAVPVGPNARPPQPGRNPASGYKHGLAFARRRRVSGKRPSRFDRR